MHRRCTRVLRNVELGLPTIPLPGFNCRRQYSNAGHDHSGSLSQEEREFALKVTRQLVDRAAAGPGHGWTLTPTLRGEEKRSVQSIRNAGQLGRFTSKEKLQFQASSQNEAEEDDVQTIDPSDSIAVPGAFVEIQRSNLFFPKRRLVR